MTFLSFGVCAKNGWKKGKMTNAAGPFGPRREVVVVEG